MENRADSVSEGGPASENLRRLVNKGLGLKQLVRQQMRLQLGDDLELAVLILPKLLYSITVHFCSIHLKCVLTKINV